MKNKQIRVKWETIVGKKYEGVVINYESGVATVRLDDGTTKAIEADYLEYA